MSAFFCKTCFFTQSNSMKAFLEMFCLFSVFVRQKLIAIENVSFIDNASRIRLRIAENWPYTEKITSQSSEMTSSSIFFTLQCFLVKLSYWSKFRVNILTGSGVTTIFVYKGFRKYHCLSFTQYLETGAS